MIQGDNKMKISVKILSILMVMVMALGMASCKKDEVDINELQKNDGVMLTITRHPQEAMTIEDQRANTTVQKVTYDGLAYNPNPVNKDGIKMSDEDYLKIYEFCIKNVKKSKFKNYSEDVCDGDTYTFAFYDLDGNPTVIYDGYCYSNEDLQDIKKTIQKYAVK